MQVTGLLRPAFAVAFCTFIAAEPASAQHQPVHIGSMPPRHSNILADARGRSIDEALDRQHYRGAAPLAVVVQTGSVNAVQMTALGFRNVKPNIAGYLVQVDVHDATGNYQDLYVYNPQSHFVMKQIEKVVLPKAASQSRIRKP